MRRAASLAGWLALVACGSSADEPTLPAAEAQAMLAAHRDGFERFEDWASRTASADARFTDPAALAEVAFSPIARDRTIAYAAIERTGSGDLRLVHPAE